MRTAITPVDGIVRVFEAITNMETEAVRTTVTNEKGVASF